ncbi:MAG: LLM class flavin-dependent oxidoreductase [Actinobacteria bacterium]|nr:LLM class flavin-dependent oxidoreductase [Actinomycetota bacterium]
MAFFCQNYSDWDRHDAQAWDQPSALSDTQMYDEEIALGVQAEPLGFDSLWTVEHHFTPYTMIPNPLQVLSYFAAKTSRIDVGTMVVVLPWHDPIRIVEEVAVLDHLLQGRRLRLGVGRGAAKLEFDGLGIDMSTSRERFLEALDVVRKGLTQPVLEHSGKYFQIPPVHVRPQPRHRDLVDDMYMAWGSPSSVAIAAEAGLRPLVVPQKEWRTHVDEMVEYNRIRAELGFAPASPSVLLGVYVHEDPDVAEREGRRYMDEWTDSALRHYRFADTEHLKDVKGYEYYNDLAAKFTAEGALQERTAHLERQLSGDAGDMSEMRSYLTDSHVWGTPDSVFEQIRERIGGIGGEEIVGVFKCGTMSYDVANDSLNLFARTVLPRLQALPATAPVTAAGRPT